MEILGIGMPELIFVIIIALLILGPKDMQKAGKTIGKFLRNVITSDGWKLFQQTSRDLRTLPNRLMREANEELEQVNREIKSAASFPDPTRSAPANSRPQPQPFAATPAPKPVTENNSIAPVEPVKKDTESDSQNNA
jgi:Sec-independent protein translocase protein TatA